ncbi:alpha/beta fold hydrolase [Paenibacillus favisporus]|uniref:alpha/beta fold hydrolase n=1 Tax=Paenibacillus favisporus TaxID=221028 RepID=UPI003D2968EF
MKESANQRGYFSSSPAACQHKAPELVIHGMDDPLFVQPCGEDTASAIPDTEFMLIDGVGHDLPHQLYKEIADAIERTAHRN